MKIKRKGYKPRCLGFWSDLDGYVSVRDRLFAAVDALYEANSIDDIIHCMSDISFCCSTILKFGSRKIAKF